MGKGRQSHGVSNIPRGIHLEGARLIYLIAYVH